MTPGVENLMRVLEQADSIDLAEGRLAYSRYNEVCRRIAERYDYELEKTIAVFAALSPNNDYRGNIRSTLSVIEGHKTGKSLGRIKISTYNHCRDRAFSYLEGVDFLGTVKGEKIRSFYLNILNPLNPSPVTIDGHAVNAWRGERVNLKTVVRERGFKYDEVADDFRTVAQIALMLPNQLQATIWFTWKRIHRIIYKPRQLHLFRDVSEDFWQTLTTFEDVCAYQ